MRAVTLLFVVATSSMLAAQAQYIGVEQRTQIFSGFSQPIEPFHIVGNIHYVGAQNIAAYLFTNPEGHILIDTGTSLMQAQLAGNIEKLGFKTSDVKIMLSSHAHVDHVQGHAYMKRVTGAQVMAIAEDAKALETGTDISPIAWEGWEPVKVDRVLRDGDTVTLGATTLRAVWTPGHTPGCTTWTTTARDNTRSYNVVIPCGVGPNPGPPLIGNRQHANIVEQSLSTVKKLRALNPDIVLPGHPQQAFAGKIEGMKAGTTPHPLLMAPGAWATQVANQEANFMKRLEAEKARVSSR